MIAYRLMYSQRAGGGFLSSTVSVNIMNFKVQVTKLVA